jgi:hypothetical protein
MPTDWKRAQQKSVITARWAVTMTKVRIRQVLSRTRWQLVTFSGKAGGESVGIVDLLAIRKDHRKPANGTKRGDMLQIVLIQVKGGSAAMPTEEDGRRLQVVARRVHAQHVLLATWKRGSAVIFFSHNPRATVAARRWAEVVDLGSVFR